MKAPTVAFVTAWIALTGVSGCAAHQNPDFGDSVRHVFSQQYADPAAARDPDPEMPEHGDGRRAERVLETYRTSTGAPEKVRTEIIVDGGSREGS